ncbi:MAG: hypothetical protein AB7E79_01215 [Rhodospirillaceae bacterium]
MAFNPLNLPGSYPGEGTAGDDAARVVKGFAVKFNARDLQGMDEFLHFPHVILAGEHLTIWDGPGQMPSDLFVELAKAGWHHSDYHEVTPVLVAPHKVHFYVHYTRNQPDGTVISDHRNLWIVTFDNGRWGIKQRSY